MVGLVLCLAMGMARAACDRQPIASLPLIVGQSALFVPVYIDGIAQNMLLDTGASVTTLSQAAADAANITHDFDRTMPVEGVGNTSNHLYIGLVDSFQIGSLHLVRQRMPIAALAVTLPDGSKAGGLLGADILGHFDIDLDMPGQRITFWRVGACDDPRPGWAFATSAVPLHQDADGHITVPARLNETHLDLTLDTGASGLVLTTLAAARAGAGADDLANDPDFTGRAVNNAPFTGHVHVFDQLTLGATVYHQIPASVVYGSRFFAYDGLLGLDFLRHRRVWLSYSSQQLFW